MSFTDTQQTLWDHATDNKMRQRDLPLDEHPLHMHSTHHIIKLTTILGRDFYMYCVGSDQVTWTEQRTGAYRYSDTRLGQDCLRHDSQQAEDNSRARGVDGIITIETVN